MCFKNLLMSQPVILIGGIAAIGVATFICIWAVKQHPTASSRIILGKIGKQPKMVKIKRPKKRPLETTTGV